MVEPLKKNILACVSFNRVLTDLKFNIQSENSIFSLNKVVSMGQTTKVGTAYTLDLNGSCHVY